jgi:hypothetical protein
MYDMANKKFIDEPINLMPAKYHLEFRPNMISNPPPDEEIKIRRLRVRCSMLGYVGNLEYAGYGDWIIDNVCPVF